MVDATAAGNHGDPRAIAAEAAALLVLGYGGAGIPDRENDLLTALGRIGELCYGSEPAWRVRRLAPDAADPDAPTRAGLRRAIDGLAAASPGPRLVIAIGAVVATIAGPALVCASSLGDYPEDTSLPLAWIGDHLDRRGPAIVCILIADGTESERRRWLGELTARGPGLVVVATGAADTLAAVRDGLAGDAIDRATGTVTAASLSRYLNARLAGAAIQTSTATTSIVTPRPVAGPRDRRISRLLVTTGAADPDDDLMGVVLPGRFEVRAEVGRGGFGVVYRAHHDLLDRDVAVKVLALGHDASLQGVELCLHEIQSLSRLDHRNVVRIYGADVLPRRRMFFVMELLAGRDLQRILDDEGALPPARALAISTQLLGGLAAAHAAGVIHADVKPGNVIVVAEGDGERAVLVDFGMARLRDSRPVAAVGGTRGFMAPEQRHDGRIDVRTDLYGAARLSVALFTGWQPNSDEEPAPLDRIADPAVRTALGRALADAPADRFASAEELIAALGGEVTAPPAVPRPPFRPAAPFTEADRDDLHGRDRELESLLDAAMFRRAVVLTAPTGTGKTSLLRAGLVPLLRDHQVSVVYLACRAGTTTRDELAEALRGVTRDRDRPPRRTVIILDQLEAALTDAPGAATGELVMAALDTTRRQGAAEVAVVLSVREEFLARLLEQTQPIEPGLPVLRLGPLTPAGARQVIDFSVATRRLTIEPALLDTLVADLERAGAGLAAQLGWGSAPAVYPPHLQLAGAMLCEALPDGSAILGLDLYRRLGGLAHILGEHLHRVLEVELTPARTAIARDVLLALVTTAQLRAARSEAELVAMARQASAPAEPPRTAATVVEVISFLRDRGLLVSVLGPGRETSWELAHDSLVPRIQAWITATDLARRRALELVRYHLRRAQPGVPSLLAPGELAEIARCTTPRDLHDLDAEWAGSEAAGAHPATTLLGLSRRALRARRIMVGTAVAITAAIVIVLIARWQSERRQREYEAALRARDIGRFTLELSAFDWDPQTQTATDVPLRDLPELAWTLYKPDPADPATPGPRYPTADLDLRILPPSSPTRNIAAVAARGGPAVLVIHGRGRRRLDGSTERCNDSIVPIRRLPGYSEPGAPPAYRIRVPTCDTTRADTIEIPAGRFIAGGLGDPAASFVPSDLPAEVEVDMAAFRIDRTEVTNGAFAIFAAFDALHGIAMADYPPSVELRAARGLAYPITFVTWPEAHAYCRYLGKDLPTLDQWDKALRGGLTVRGAPNPSPRRTFAWAGGFVPGGAAVPDVPAHRRPVPVGSFPLDTSPDGVVDLTGNVMEWTLAIPPRTGADDPRLRDELARAADLAPRGRFRIMRGCGWDETLCVGGQDQVNALALPNMRALDLRNFMLGFRCALRSE